MLQTILIVDDSPVARMIMKKCLPAGHNLTIFEAGNGQQGVEQYERHRPDLTFMDLTMPVMDGFEALRRIKQINPQAVVIVATADIQEKVLQRVATFGALYTLKKPPTKEALAQALERGAAALQQVSS
ncbi:MAG: response regulator [Desulfuromonas sp.]|jgi:two-component system chemotaxis response regulator CheY|nr:response regulator [Desulfuromonas thiophila]MDD3801321.1 response regulator [Desulfuromonas thiophila]MDY0397246.1 response regulator [Desulfuromonas thiophila]